MAERVTHQRPGPLAVPMGRAEGHTEEPHRRAMCTHTKTAGAVQDSVPYRSRRI